MNHKIHQFIWIYTITMSKFIDKIKNLANSDKQQYKAHSIDHFVVEFLESKDKSSFRSSDKIFFFRELSYMLKWWVWLVTAVNTISQWTDNYAVREIANLINKYLMTWKSLSYAMDRLPDYFDEWDCNVVKAWEKSGNLYIVLDSLAQEYEFITEIKNKYIWALIYPIILIIFAIVAIIALFGFILPSVFDIAAWMSAEQLPLSTRILKWISDFLIGYWKPIVWVVVWITAFLWLYFSTEKGKKAWFDLLLSMPLIWKMTRYYYLVRWCRYMNLMIKSGMNYIETFKTLRDVLWIAAYQEMIERVLWGLQKWTTIYESLKDEKNLIPTNVAVLIKVWEETANLEWSLMNVLNMYQEELNVTINSISKVIEPVILVGIGIIVLLVASWVFWLLLQIMEWVA